jgi:hypothetical protein
VFGVMPANCCSAGVAEADEASEVAVIGGSGVQRKFQLAAGLQPMIDPLSTLAEELFSERPDPTGAPV